MIFYKMAKNGSLKIFQHWNRWLSGDSVEESRRRVMAYVLFCSIMPRQKKQRTSYNHPHYPVSSTSGSADDAEGIVLILLQWYYVLLFLE